MTRSLHLRVRVPAALLAATFGAGALAGVDVVVENGDRIQGSVEAPETGDVFRIRCPAGAAMSVKAKGKKGLDATVDVLAPEGGAPLRGPTLDELPESGVYTVRVGGAGEDRGDYKLSIRVKPPKKLSRDVVLGEGEASVPFAVEAGTLLQAKAKAAKGSAAVPRLLRIEGPDGLEIDLGGVAKSASTRLGRTELPRPGDYRLVLDDAGGAGGEVALALKLKPPKPARRKIDLRGRSIGDPGGERLAVSKVVGTEGGTVGVALPGEGGPDSVIAGASVSVPSGALTSPTPVFVATSSPVRPKGDDGSAGPSVFFGPEGLRFRENVAVTIPFDAAQFEGDFSKLRIYTRDARGRVSLVDGPYDFDLDRGTCTFQVAHFSSFVAARAGARARFREIVGVWRLPPEPGEDATSFLVIREDGSVDVVTDVPFQQQCFITRILPPGTPLDAVFEIVDGRLRLIDEPDPEYERAQERDLPENCDGFTPP